MLKEGFTTTSDNLSMAWYEVLVKMMDAGNEELMPVVIKIRDFDNGIVVENETIRIRLDAVLKKVGKKSCSEVSHTIFPESLWNPTLNDDGEQLFSRFNNIWPRVRKAKSANRSGTYFQRMTSFRSINGDEPINQLRHVIDTYKNHDNHRRSALLVSIFDPALDHSHARIQGFPCLQQVSFARTESGGLCVTGFYALQYQFEKAYGNYLGLCHLGHFMANCMGLKLEQVNCIASVAKRASSKKDISELMDLISTDLKSEEK